MNDQVKAIKSVSQIVTELRSRFELFRSNRPLAIGIHNQLAAEYPQREVEKALGRHTSTTAYLRNVKYGIHRFNLDGSVASELSADQKEAARIRLNLRTDSKQRERRLIKHIGNPKKTEKVIFQHDRRQARNLKRLQNVVKAIQV